MIRYQLIWYNYITQEECVDYILAKNDADAKEIAILWVKRWVGHNNSFAEKSIRSLSEWCEIDDVTRESIEKYYDSKYQYFDKATCDWRYHSACVSDVNCFENCHMPCPYDKKQSPCDMCTIDNCQKDSCLALQIYNGVKRDAE